MESTDTAASQGLFESDGIAGDPEPDDETAQAPAAEADTGAYDDDDESGQEPQGGDEELDAEPSNQQVWDRLDALSGQIEPLSDHLRAQQAGYDQDLPYQEPEPQGPSPLEQALIDQGIDPEVVTGIVEQQVQQQVAQHVAPIAEWQQDQELLALEGKYPKLKDPETAGQVLAQSEALAARFGAPHLATDPEVVETVYKAMLADESSEREVPAGSKREVQLEGKGGRRPAPKPQQDAGDAIVAAGRRSQGLFDKD